MTIGHRFLTQNIGGGNINIDASLGDSERSHQTRNNTKVPMQEPKQFPRGQYVNETFTFKDKCWCPVFASHIEITFCLQTFPFLPMYHAS
jgi:hypothetical protein